MIILYENRGDKSYVISMYSDNLEDAAVADFENLRKQYPDKLYGLTRSENGEIDKNIN